MSLSARQLQLHVVRPVLAHLGAEFGGLAAERLIIGTALTETQGKFIDQVTGPGDIKLGPAIGIYQIEPATEADVWKYLNHRLMPELEATLAPWPDRSVQLATNLAYASAMCRLIYWRAPSPLPSPEDLHGLAAYWKQFYNTPKGAGTVEKFIGHAAPVMELPSDAPSA